MTTQVAGSVEKKDTSKYSNNFSQIDVTIWPDIQWLQTEKRQKMVHQLRNESGFPIVCRVKGNPKKIACTTPYFVVESKGWFTLQIIRFEGPLKSLRIDIDCMPGVGPLTTTENWALVPQLFFQQEYVPVTKHIRYKSPHPWTSTVSQLSSDIPINPKFGAWCKKIGVKKSENETILQVNEFSLLNTVLSNDFEKKLPKYDSSKNRPGIDPTPKIKM